MKYFNWVSKIFGFWDKPLLRICDGKEWHHDSEKRKRKKWLIFPYNFENRNSSIKQNRVCSYTLQQFLFPKFLAHLNSILSFLLEKLMESSTTIKTSLDLNFNPPPYTADESPLTHTPSPLKEQVHITSHHCYSPINQSEKVLIKVLIGSCRLQPFLRKNWIG